MRHCHKNRVCIFRCRYPYCLFGTERGIRTLACMILNHVPLPLGYLGLSLIEYVQKQRIEFHFVSSGYRLRRFA